jgi:hypothetical protein
MSERGTHDERPLSEAELRFEQRARALLLESVDGLSAQTRSRLNRARQAALAPRPAWSGSLVRHWVPAGAGALAVAVLAIMIIGVPHRGENPAVSPLAAASPEDLEMLADSDAVQLGREEDVDYDFYEWAVGEATGASAPSEGT